MNSESEEEDNVINGGDSRMIYTMTLSPALDYIISIENFNKDTVNRNEKEEVFVGGKGINVSQVLKNLDIENVALGFVAGFTGEKIERDLAEYGCFVDFVHLRQGMSRINIKIKGGSGVLNEKRETEINGMGPTVPQDKLVQLFERLDQISTNDILVLAGADRSQNHRIKLDYLQVTSGVGVRSVASLGLNIAGEKFEACASGNGPVDAAIKALKKIVDRHMTLKEFTIQAISKGSDDVGKVHMQVEYDNQIYYGFGANTDIIAASVEAYIDCINKFKS